MLAVASPPSCNPFTVDEYFKLGDAGFLGDDKVELIEGRIRRMHAQGTTHQAAMTLGSIVLSRHFPPTTHWVVMGGTLRLSKVSAPDPDLCVIDVPVRTPGTNRPLPLLVIEISDTSYKKDAGSKLRMYAKAGVQDYWIENLISRRVEVYRQPENPTGAEKGWGYAMIRHYKSGESIPLLARPDISICVDELLP